MTDPNNDVSVIPLDWYLLDAATAQVVELLRETIPLPDSEKPPCLMNAQSGGRACIAEGM